LFGSRPAQQVTKLVTYETECGFDLLEKVDLPRTAAEVKIDVPRQERRVEQPNQLTLFKDGAKGPNFGAGIGWRENGTAWREDGPWKTRLMPLGKYLTAVEAELLAIYMAVKKAGSTAIGTGYWRVEVVSDSQKALTLIKRARQWIPLVTKNIRRQIR
jgi:hypothetical protein